MSEYITDWFGIGVQLANMYESRTPLCLWPKRIRDERRREEIVRCRDCKRYQPREGAMFSCRFEYKSFVQWRYAEPDGFCAWAERKILDDER